MEFVKKRRSKNIKNEVAKKQKVRSTKGKPLTEKQKLKKKLKRFKLQTKIPKPYVVYRIMPSIVPKVPTESMIPGGRIMRKVLTMDP